MAFPSRIERFEIVGSTNDVVAAWLREGTPEVCVAVADAQRAGRGRHGRSWVAPAGAALLLSVGFRPTWLAPDRTWRLAAVVALAMADAAEDLAGLADGTIRLKWPNDLAVAFSATGRPVGAAAVLDPDRPIDIRKLAGLLGETDGLGTSTVRAVVGIGLNADWPRDAFPPDLAAGMTSLREASGGRPIDRAALLDGFLARLETRVEALRGGYFDVAGWRSRQLTDGRLVRLERPDGAVETLRALGVDATTGALIVAGARPGDPERAVLVGEIRHLRLGGSAPAAGSSDSRAEV
ncbi:MAG TPA: biotin--[acetyl-CoA-carboxylase] ligase [Candidatus Limnocylindrales bacterium]|nr:biotin--[acetyl-CoA-carboxylase] ligase [Candidatus Limnocylindrales bacterium]